MKTKECGNTLGIRYPDAPVDQWDSATCIRTHDASPGAVRVIHDSGDGWRWLLLDGFKDDDPLIIPGAELKELRETLSRARGAIQAIATEKWSTPEDDADVDRIDRLVAEIDRRLGE